jgi:hypothetical protein
LKKFLVKVGIALVMVVAVHGITVLVFGNGKIDGFYLRFTAPKQHSLVVGNSRAAQGIVPSVVDESLSGLNFQGSLFNYGFSLSTSPYGPYYLASIKKKLDPSTRHGLFILSVDPWSISREAHLTDEDTTHYFEASSLPNNMYFVNSSPNIEYLFKNYYKGWGDMIVANTLRTVQAELHPDGWLEVTIPMNKAKHDARIRDKVQRYKSENVYAKTFSPVRLAYLKKTIQYLKTQGEVFLVRIPLDSRLAKIESEYLPEFDQLMNECSAKTGVPYLNYFADNDLYQTTDGNHLYKESAKLFSKKLSEDIRKYMLTKGEKGN